MNYGQADFDGNQLLWAAVTALLCSGLDAREQAKGLSKELE